jgi:hypothetical protein
MFKYIQRMLYAAAEATYLRGEESTTKMRESGHIKVHV